MMHDARARWRTTTKPPARCWRFRTVKKLPSVFIDFEGGPAQASPNHPVSDRLELWRRAPGMGRGVMHARVVDLWKQKRKKKEEVEGEFSWRC